MLEIKRKNGIEISVSNKTKIRLDPKKSMKNALNFISHAHMDHVPRYSENNSPIISDPITLSVINERLKKELPFDNIEPPEGYSLLGSGHCIGGKMLLIELEEISKKILYTGDFSTKERLDLFPPAKPVKTDILIIEGTYGNSNHNHPDPQEIFSDMYEWIHSQIESENSVLLQTYAFGKAQIVSRFLELVNLPYYVEKPIHNIHQILNNYNFDFKGKLAKGSEVYKPGIIVVGTYHTKRNLRFDSTASFTGWSKETKNRFQTRSDKLFALSDHLDFESLLKFIEDCDPETVLVFDGSSENLAEEIRKKININALSLDNGIYS